MMYSYFTRCVAGTHGAVAAAVAAAASCQENRENDFLAELCASIGLLLTAEHLIFAKNCFTSWARTYAPDRETYKIAYA